MLHDFAKEFVCDFRVLGKANADNPVEGDPFGGGWEDRHNREVWGLDAVRSSAFIANVTAIRTLADGKKRACDKIVLATARGSDSPRR